MCCFVTIILYLVLCCHEMEAVTSQLCASPIPPLHVEKDENGNGGTADSTPLEFSELIPNPKLYDRMRPPKISGEPTKVEFHVTVMGLDSINEYSMTYAADIFVSQTWKDSRLRLPENMTTDYRLLEVGWLQQMWRPDSFFKNAKQVTFQTMTIPNHYLWLYKDKSILYMVKLTLTLSCSMNFALYPHDTQECKLQMESLSHTTDDLIFEWEHKVPLVVDKIELPQLQLVENRTEDCSQVYSTGNFTCLQIVFVLKRRLGYYLFHTYIPTCLIVIMSWISFWIAPEAAPARVTLGVTSLLTLSTQHAKSQAGLPPVSYLKAVDLFMSACTLFVFLALMEYCLVNIVLGDSFDQKSRRQFFKSKNQGSKIYQISMSSPRCSSRNSTTRTSSSVAEHPCLMEFEDVPPAPPPPKLRNTCTSNEKRMKALAVDRYSRVIFPLTFTILNCIYWITFMEYL